MTLKRTRTTLLGVSIGLIATITGPLCGDVIILKEKDKDGKQLRLYGKIVKTTGVSDKEAVVIELAGGKRNSVLRAKIESVEPSVNEKELESLAPRSPEKYFELGERYVKSAEDPEARACAQHLLKASIELDSKKYALAAHCLLAELADGEEEIAHLLEMLRLDPQNQWAVNELRELIASQSNPFEDELTGLHQSVRLALDEGRVAPLVLLAKSQDSSRVFERFAPACPQLREELQAISIQLDCATCKGTTMTKCPSCNGGQIKCQNCRGKGLLRSTVTSQITNPGTGERFTRVTPTSKKCPRCNGKKKFTCSYCQSGLRPCAACSSKKVTRPIASSLKEKLNTLESIIGSRPGESWARELLVEDRGPFRGLESLRKAEEVKGIEGRYYRRGGQWQTTP